MTIYTVEYNGASEKNWIIAFREKVNAEAFAKKDFTESVVAHRFKSEENATEYVKNKTWFSQCVEDVKSEEASIIKEMAGIRK